MKPIWWIIGITVAIYVLVIRWNVFGISVPTGGSQ